MFTKEEFFLMWLPLMIVSAVLFSLMVANNALNIGSAIMGEVVLGILLKVIARKINPANEKNQPEDHSNEAQ